MFLIEADGRRVLHTGDFRGHGYLSKALMPIIEKRILRGGPVDFLITEGTMLSRPGERVMSENELQKEAGNLMRRYRNVFVMCSSTDMERLASFHAAHRRTGRGPLVCDKFQKKILTIFRETAGKHSRLFLFDKVYDFRVWNDKVLDWMSQEGFCMFVRATDKFAEWWRMLAPRLDPAETVLIYSMWSGYVTPDGPHAVPRYLDFVSQFPHTRRLHTSGHASPEILAEVCRAVNPARGIIPIHSEHSATFADLPIGDELCAKVITASITVNDVRISVRN